MNFWRMRPLEWKAVRPGYFEAAFHDGFATLQSDGKRKPWTWFLRFGSGYDEIRKGEAKSKQEAIDAVALVLETIVSACYLEPAQRDTDCGNTYRYTGILRPRCSNGVGCDACWRKYEERRERVKLESQRLQKVKA